MDDLSLLSVELNQGHTLIPEQGLEHLHYLSDYQLDRCGVVSLGLASPKQIGGSVGSYNITCVIKCPKPILILKALQTQGPSASRVRLKIKYIPNRLNEWVTPWY